MSLNIHAAFLCSFQHKPISFSFSSQNSHSPRHSFLTHPPPTTARLSAFVPFVPFIHSCRLLLVTIEWLWTELLYYCKQRKAESSSSLLMRVKNLNDFRFFFPLALPLVLGVIFIFFLLTVCQLPCHSILRRFFFLFETFCLSSTAAAFDILRLIRKKVVCYYFFSRIAGSLKLWGSSLRMCQKLNYKNFHVLNEKLSLIGNAKAEKLWENPIKRRFRLQLFFNYY